MSNVLIALDESTQSTGYAVFKDSKLIDYGTYTHKSKNVLERVNYILHQIDFLIEEYNPNNIAIENIQISLSASTAHALMGLQFAIELMAYRLGIPCTLVRTAHWRKVLGLSNSPKLKRQDKKLEAINHVKDTYGIETKVDDICDAICIGEAFLKENEIME